MQMEGWSHDERGDGKDEVEEDEDHVLPELGDEGIREEGHLVRGKEDLGGEKPHVGLGGQFPRPQKVWAVRLEVSNVRPTSERGPGTRLTLWRVWGPERGCRPYKRGVAGAVLHRWWLGGTKWTGTRWFWDYCTAARQERWTSHIFVLHDNLSTIYLNFKDDQCQKSATLISEYYSAAPLW